MQGDDGLAGAGTAFDDQDAGVVEADDLVLFGLDGGDDVAHTRAARGVHRGEQGRVGALVAARAAEDLVGEGDDLPAPGVELAAAAHVLRVGGGGDVEGAGGGGSPVEQQGFELVVLVVEADAADVVAFAGDGVQAAEAQAVVGHAEALDLPGEGADFHVPLHR
ncbi:Uncharacterised protein [Mycobacteroides abscessus subsp. abscessus]|nr:Uncharacterised protein [Mycobacteroides abscessus subsp. abscessus]